MSAQPCLETARLRLVPFSVEHSERLSNLAGDIRVAKETMNIPHPYTPKMADAWIRSLEKKWNSKERVEYAIELKQSRDLIGGVGYVSWEGDDAELGYWIGVPYWGCGYCTEAGKSLIEFGSNTLFIKRIMGRHLATNPGSGKVLRKLGFSWKESKLGEDRYGDRVDFEFYELRNN